MDDQQWLDISRDLASSDVDRKVAACETLHEQAQREDIPRLLDLLTHSDWFIREAAAWPLAELAGAQVLPQLLAAYQRGFDDGHDNDGFSAALLEIPALFPESQSDVARLLETANGALREDLEWLLTFY